MAERVRLIEEEEVSSIVRDGKIVAIRWDLVRWALVLDLDAPVSEAKNAPSRRVWLVFYGLSDLWWSFNGVRIPNGCWVTSSIGADPVTDGFKKYRFGVLLPRFRGLDALEENPTHEVVVRAQGLRGVVSVQTAEGDEWGLSWGDRRSLGSDEEMLAVFGENAS